MSEKYLDVTESVDDANPIVVAALLESVGEVLREAPDGKRYDMELRVKEL